MKGFGIDSMSSAGQMSTTYIPRQTTSPTLRVSSVSLNGSSGSAKQCVAKNQILFFSFNRVTYGPQHNKTNKMAYAPSEDSDQRGHPPSLIRVVDVRFLSGLGPNGSSCGQRRLVILTYRSSRINAHSMFPLFLDNWKFISRISTMSSQTSRRLLTGYGTKPYGQL